MPKYYVIAEFIDATTGKHLYPGDKVEITEERAELFQSAKVINDSIIPESPKESEKSISTPVTKAGGKDETQSNTTGRSGTTKPGGSKRTSKN